MAGRIWLEELQVIQKHIKLCKGFEKIKTLVG